MLAVVNPILFKKSFSTGAQKLTAEKKAGQVEGAQASPDRRPRRGLPGLSLTTVRRG